MYITPIINNFNNNRYRINICNKQNFNGRYVSYAQLDEKIKEGDITALKNAPDVHITSNKFESLLHSSAKYDNERITRYLLKEKLNPNQKNSHGKSPFAIACSRLNKTHVEAFLPYNPDVNSQDNLQNTPLHQAVKSPQIIELLLQNGANPYNKNVFGKTPFTVSYNYPASLEAYLKFGVNPNTTDSKSKTLMHEAINDSNINIAKILKKYNADTNYKDENGQSPIFNAKNYETMKWLIDNNAKINLTDKNGQTALHLKVINGDIKNSENLLKLKADPNIKDINNLSPIAYAKTINAMKLLLDYGAKPDVITPNGSSILHNAVKSNNIKGIYYLCEADANPNILDKNMNIPYDYTSSKDAKILLLASGSNPNFKNYLKDSLKNNDSEIFSYLLECGANPNRPDEYGKTAAFYINSEDEIKELKKYKADLNFYNLSGYTPMHHFALLGNKKMVELFKQSGVPELKSLNGESIDDCYYKFETYSPWFKNKSGIKINFTGRPYYIYGTPELRQDLNYKTQLTKEQIDDVICSAPSLDKGIYDAYKLLNKEETAIYTAMNSLWPVLKHFDIIIKEDINDIVKKNPSGSKIPLFGYFVQLAKTQFSDKFIQEIEAEAQNIANQYDDILDHYYFKNIKTNIEKYYELNNYLSEGIKYVNYVNGDSRNRNKILSNIEERKFKFSQRHNKYMNSINKQSQKYQKLVNKLTSFQEDKQNKRTFKKAVIKFVTIGMA